MNYFVEREGGEKRKGTDQLYDWWGNLCFRQYFLAAYWNREVRKREGERGWEVRERKAESRD